MPDTPETLLVKLTVKRVGVSRKVDGDDLSEVTGGRAIDPVFFGATKKLWACKEYDDCGSACNEARALLAKRAVPAPFIGKGFSLLRADRYPIVDDELKQAQRKLTVAVDQFLAVFPERVAESQLELTRNGIPWTAAEYPTADQVRDGFAIQWQPMEFGVPQVLARVDRDAFEAAKLDAERRWASAMQECERVLAAELKTLIDSMVERLTPGEDGKKKVFRDSLVGNLRDFLRECPFRNVSGSDELDSFCREAASILGNESADSLRSSPGMRDYVRERMATVSQALDQAIIQAPARKIIVFNPQAAIPFPAAAEGA